MAVVWMRDVLVVQDKWESQCPQHSDGPAVDGLTKPRYAYLFSELECLDCIARFCLEVCFSLLCFD